ncbi:MAG: hypothetical protein PHG14_01440 [Desulfobacter postgatei]|jgi:hypothetical protein|uniref:Uncharacterized protein n=1 Tax=Desulfobacter postgatei 2ac9 TaxID=879212 RepID=I5B468_9BACT|nr:hypothetical protein [Desulfobacter postgatei]EIM64281.1 hypothetical protein DespoDRAFT_02427 [Desulfobacter postgatei 2ac9]MDD4272374.1 hypothetical protein [Desulfobacter postgatei]MDX9964616.1 hypothetical protein [Desulfobacter postgatei]
MDIPRKLGVLIFTAVPAIVGGGIVYHLFGSFTQVIIWEVLLVLAALGFISS